MPIIEAFFTSNFRSDSQPIGVRQATTYLSNVSQQLYIYHRIQDKDTKDEVSESQSGSRDLLPKTPVARCWTAV